LVERGRLEQKTGESVDLVMADVDVVIIFALFSLVFLKNPSLTSEGWE
jgi:hypothetical protein